MRRLVPILGILALACAGLSPSTTFVSREALQIHLVDGDVSTDEDRGAAGRIRVDVGLSGQTLRWQPIDPDRDLRAHAEAQATELRRLKSASNAMIDVGPLVPVRVGELPAFEFESRFGPFATLTTAWRCEAAGIDAQLSTTGWSRRVVHDVSLSSARCGDKPVVGRGPPPNWRFAAELATWEVLRDPFGSERLTGPDGAVVTVENAGRLWGFDDPDEACARLIGRTLRDSEAWLQIAEAPAVRHGGAGCHAVVRGRNLKTDTEVEGAVRVLQCPAGALTVVCAGPVEAGSDPMEACVRWVGCAAP